MPRPTTPLQALLHLSARRRPKPHPLTPTNHRTQVINKFTDILEQFAREIEQTHDIFEAHKHAPPVTKNQPPVAGAIKWARALLARVKQTMVKLHSTEEEIIRTTGACRT